MSVRGLVVVLASLMVLSGCEAASTESPEQPAGVDLSVAEQGWGPDRPLYTHDAPPSSAVMNSMTDDPVWGDERSFLSLRAVGEETWISDGTLQVRPGGRYEAWISFHNDASPESASVSRRTRVSATLPATVAGRERVTAVVMSGTADPPKVWRSLVLATSGSPVAIRIASDTATLHTERLRTGISVPAGELFSPRGVLVGCDGMTGDVTGEDDCRGEIRFEFVADQPNFTITQWAARSGSKEYEYAPRATAGDELDIKVRYENTGTTKQNDVVVRYRLPTQLSYVPGTTALATSATGGKWRGIEDDDVVRGGVNVGSYLPGGVSYVRFTVRVDAVASRCGIDLVTGTATADTNNGGKSHEMTVEIERAC